LARTVNAAREADARRRPNGGTASAGPRRAARGLRIAVDGGDGLHQVVRTHLERFLAETAAATEGAGVPRFIEREFRDFLGCGALDRGFARVRCDACRFERLVPFSCKARAVCPSCGGRRMAEQAAHLVETTLPLVPVRQWVLTVPHRLRYRLAFDHALCRAVLGVFIRAVLGWYRRRGRRGGVPDGQSGTVTVVQRFGSGLELNVHFHALSLDGVFAPERTGRSASTACRRPARPTSPGSWRQSRAGSSGCSCAADSPTTPTP